LHLVDDLAALAGVRVDPVYPLVVHLHFEVLGPAAVAAKPAPYLGGALHQDDSIGPRPRRALQPGLRLAGVIPGQNVAVIAVQPHGADAIELTYKTGDGGLGQRVLGREAEANLAIAHAEGRPLDAAAADFKLVAECQRIKLAGLWDPMLAVTTSDIQPLPHQLRAVYGELLPRTPLRFLLADDPGAGKTIMAGSRPRLSPNSLLLVQEAELLT
jgi:hypothetical protein